MRNVLKLFAAALLFQSTAALAQEQAEPERTIMVLDASGSMWGQIDGTPKISIAREVINGLLTDWNEGVELGLMAYGHRTKGDCNDIETLAEIGPVDQSALTGLINQLNPKGKTPISASVRQAAQQLRYTEEKATVILVSDGLETCNADPCALAKELEAAGVDFTTHVVGFDIKEEETAGLKCLADNTGGKFLRADNANELTSALQQTVAAVVDTTPAPQPDPTGPGNVYLTAKMCDSCDLLGGVVDYKVLTAAVGANGKREQVAVQYDRDRTDFSLTEGDYVVVVSYGSVSRQIDLSVDAGQTIERTIDLDGGFASFDGVLVDGGETLGPVVDYRIETAGVGEDGKRQYVAVQYDTAKSNFVLPVGDYVVLAGYGNANRQIEFSVQAGETTEDTIILNAGFASMDAIMSEGQETLGPVVDYRVESAEVGPDGKRKYISVIYDTAKAKFVLPEGDFVVLASYGKATKLREFSVAAAETTELTVNLEAGIARFTGVLSEGKEMLGAVVDYRVSKVGEDGSKGAYVSIIYDTAKASFVLPKGSYLVEASYGKALQTLDFSVSAGKTVEGVVNLKAGTFNVSAVSKGDGSSLGRAVDLRLFRVAGDGARAIVQVVYDKSDAGFILSEGNYVIAAEYNAGANQEHMFTIREGDALEHVFRMEKD